ncbi:hypothetical protein ACFL0V_01630 [Nanoarchaeota archaeon]
MNSRQIVNTCMIILVLLILSSVSVLGQVACFCDGWVFNKGGTAVVRGTYVSVDNIDQPEFQNTTTGNGFPDPPGPDIFDNEYKTSINCSSGPNGDNVTVYARNLTHFGINRTYFSSGDIDVNVWLTQLIPNISINVTPVAKFLLINETDIYEVTISNDGTFIDNYTISVTSDMGYAVLNETDILDLASGASYTVKLTVNSTVGGDFTHDVLVVSQEVPGVNNSDIATTAVNYVPTIATPADTPDPVDNGDFINISVVATDLNGAPDTNQILVCTNNSPPVNGQCAGGSSICDNFDAPVTASTTGQTLFCQRDVTESAGTTVTYYVTAVDSYNQSAPFVTQTYTVSSAPAPPPGGGGGGGGGIDTCWDGDQNQGEEGVDCGGPCPACPTVSPPVPPSPPILPPVPPGTPIPPSGPGITPPPSLPPEVIPECEDKVSVVQKEIGELYNYSVYGMDEMQVALPIKIPEDYMLATRPFSVDCPKDLYKMAMAVPENMDDVKIIRCSGNNCRVISSANVAQPCEGAAGVPTGEQIFNFSTAPVRIEQITENLSGLDPDIIIENYNITFIGEMIDLTVTVREPEHDIRYPSNVHVIIAGTPIEIVPDGDAETIRIEAPYFVEPEDDEESLALYARKIVDGETQWMFIGGEIDFVSKTITAEANLSKYEQNGAVVIAPLTIRCEECEHTGFKNVYTPSPDSRKAVILIHGMFGLSRVWDKMINTHKVTRQPYQLWTFNYLVSRPLDETADELAEFLELNQHRFDQIDLIGFSLGGVVAQKALRKAYDAHAADPTKYTFIDKIDKSILIATPNEGSPVARFVEEYLTQYINKDAENYVPINPMTQKLLLQGALIEKVPDVRYLVIAGIEPYNWMKGGLTQEWFGDELNDGLIGLRSAQYIGGEYLDDECVNYWTRPQPHTKILSERLAQDMIGQLLGAEMWNQMSRSGEFEGLAGYSNYFEFVVNECDPQDLYIIIGKPKTIKSKIICKCGDGICSGFETPENCPEDCKKFPLWAIILIIIAILILIWIIPVILRDYLLVFCKMTKKGLEDKRMMVSIQNELLAFGFHINTLYITARVVELKEHDPLKIRDMIATELPKQISKHFFGLRVVWYWVVFNWLTLWGKHPVLTVAINKIMIGIVPERMKLPEIAGGREALAGPEKPQLEGPKKGKKKADKIKKLKPLKKIKVSDKDKKIMNLLDEVDETLEEEHDKEEELKEEFEETRKIKKLKPLKKVKISNKDKKIMDLLDEVDETLEKEHDKEEELGVEFEETEKKTRKKRKNK